MKLKSLGYRSELIFTAFDGRAEDRGDYWAIHTLSNPNFFWGNLLIFERPPQKGDFAQWTALFKKEFINPQIYHITLAWDSALAGVGDPSEFLENDFVLRSTAVLSASQVVCPPKFNDHLEVRPLSSEKEWERMIDIQTSSADDHLSRAEWEKFNRSQATRYQAMEKAGFGNWYGGFLDGQLIAGLGLFHRERIGRFQSVCTDPQYQRQGACQTMVYKVSQKMLASGLVDDLVMCADPDYHAIKIYESVGFARQALEHGVCWWDKNRSSK